MKINKNITTVNRWVGRFGYSVEWIVLHYTANTWQPDLARNECAAFADRYVGASAHFFVDENEVWQSVELTDTAWHCGDLQPSLNGCSNMSSIGIEMCVVYKNGVYSIADKTVDNTVELVEYLLTLYPSAKLCRHYDVTGKICPQPWVNDPSLWEDFKKRVEENRPMTPAERKEFDALKVTVSKQAEQIEALKASAKKTDGIIEDLEDTVAVVDERTEVKYRTVEEVPKWARPTIRKLVDEGYLKGEKAGNLALNTDLTRTLVVVDRAGGFDK